MAASLPALWALLLHGPAGPPRPRLCLRLGAPRRLFVNVCAWAAVPPPRSPAERRPARAVPLQEVDAEGDLYSVIDVAYNPDVLQGVEESPEKMEHLIHSTLAFIEERHNLVLSRSYSIEPFQLKGDLAMMQQRLGGVSETPDPQLSHNTRELTGDELPHALGAEGCSSDPVLLRGQRVTRAKGRLIEEISSTELPEKPSTPVYGMVIVRDTNKEPLTIKLRIELPQVSSAAECDLRISKDDIIMEVPEKYRLQLNLPEWVDEETTTAVFDKTKRVLFISAPVAKADPYPLYSTQLLVTD